MSQVTARERSGPAFFSQEPGTPTASWPNLHAATLESERSFRRGSASCGFSDAPFTRPSDWDLESDPWQAMEKQLEGFARVLQEQAVSLTELQRFVRVQGHTFRRMSSPGRRASAATGSSVVPRLKVFHDGNDVNPLQTFTVKESTPKSIPPIRQGFCAWLLAFLSWVVDSSVFEPCVVFLIALNALNIGWAINIELEEGDASFQNHLDKVFLVIFAAELFLRLIVRGFRSLLNFSNMLDSIIVVLTVAGELVNLVLEIPDSGFSRVLQQIVILRMVRLLRLARAVRLIASLQSLWKLVEGLLHSVSTMASALLLVFLTIYIFACFGGELIAKEYKDDVKIGSLIQQNFSTLPKILLTLFQFISMDSTAQFYVPLVQRQPLLAIYFLLLLVTVSIALVNLITAILVEDFVSSVRMDKEMKAVHRRKQMKELAPALRELYRTFDKSSEDFVHKRAISKAVKDGLEIPEALQAFLNPARILDLFDALDLDNSGGLSEEEFVNGLTHVAMSDVQIETIQMLHLLRSLRRDVSRSPWLYFCTQLPRRGSAEILPKTPEEPQRHGGGEISPKSPEEQEVAFSM